MADGNNADDSLDAIINDLPLIPLLSNVVTLEELHIDGSQPGGICECSTSGGAVVVGYNFPETGVQAARHGRKIKGVSHQGQAKVRTKYGTGIEAQRTRIHKNNGYKSSPFFIALSKRYGRVSMQLLKGMADVLQTQGIKIERSAKRCKPWLVDILSSYVPIDRIEDCIKGTMDLVTQVHSS